MALRRLFVVALGSCAARARRCPRSRSRRRPASRCLARTYLGARPAPARRPSRDGSRAAQRPSNATVPLDRVIAVVNDEALTQYELDEQKRIVLRRCARTTCGRRRPTCSSRRCSSASSSTARSCSSPRRTACASTTRWSSARSCASRRRTRSRPSDLRRALDREKVSYAKYREDIRREVTIQRLREREVDSRVQVSEAEVDNYLATVAAQAGGENEYQLAHIMVGVPEQATPDQIDARRRRAEEALAADQGRQGIPRGCGGSSPTRRTRSRAATSAGARPRGCRSCS